MRKQMMIMKSILQVVLIYQTQKIVCIWVHSILVTVQLKKLKNIIPNLMVVIIVRQHVIHLEK